VVEITWSNSSCEISCFRIFYIHWSEKWSSRQTVSLNEINRIYCRVHPRATIPTG